MSKVVVSMGASKCWHDNFRNKYAHALRQKMFKALMSVESSGVNLAKVFDGGSRGKLQKVA